MTLRWLRVKYNVMRVPCCSSEIMHSPSQWRQSCLFLVEAFFRTSRSKRKNAPGRLIDSLRVVSLGRRRRLIIVGELGKRSCARVREPVPPRLFIFNIIIIIITARLYASQADGLSPFFLSQSTNNVRYIASTIPLGPHHSHLDVWLFFYLFTIVPSVLRMSNLCVRKHTHTHTHS